MKQLLSSNGKQVWQNVIHKRREINIVGVGGEGWLSWFSAWSHTSDHGPRRGNPKKNIPILLNWAFGVWCTETQLEVVWQSSRKEEAAQQIPEICIGASRAVVEYSSKIPRDRAQTHWNLQVQQFPELTQVRKHLSCDQPEWGKLSKNLKCSVETSQKSRVSHGLHHP